MAASVYTAQAISDKTLIISRFYSNPLIEIGKCNLALRIELMFSNSSNLFYDLLVPLLEGFHNLNW